MNWAICKNTWKRCIANKLRMWILLVYILKPIIISTAQLCIQGEYSDSFFEGPNDSLVMVLICGSGVIGSQLNDGTLSLALSRPVKIVTYVFSKWFAVSVAASVATGIQLIAELIVAMSRTPALIDYSNLAVNGLERTLVCFGFSAVLVLLSSLFSGIKDLGIYLLLTLALSLIGMFSQIKGSSVPEGLARTAVEILVPVARSFAGLLQSVLPPTIDLSELTSGNMPSLSAFAMYLAVITVCLSIAIFRLNRKELPYGAD